MAVGIGMRPGTAASAILAAVRDALGASAVGCLATVDRRAGEPGLRAAAAQLGVPIVFFAPDQLSGVPVPNPSERTAAALGTPSVAEAAALLAAGTDRLALPKQVAGTITLAAATIEK
ncbi:cobalamin biosynthesis protein [Nocardia jejuensis]|uniref:cobalamin biosynthesis protein n=1 Tax=Nocardia jejuensis TaxID=328049 RepID=UPI00248188B9|nr:cobalamin biosynthesis protein [Nocardia jejuensis]